MFLLAVTDRAARLRAHRTPRGDVHLGTGAHVRCHGKGRKNRTTPLDRQTVQVLTAFITGRPSDADGFVFPTRTGTRMSRDAVAARRGSTPRPPRRPARA